MKLASFLVATAIGEFTRIGAVAEDRIVDLSAAYAAYLAATSSSGNPCKAAALIPPDMVGFLRGGSAAREGAKRAVDFVHEQMGRGGSLQAPGGGRVIHGLGDVRLLAPVPRPNSIRDTISFEGHMQNWADKTGRPIPEAWYRMPLYYKGNPMSVIGPDAPVIWPRYAEQLDYELEFGIYIGRKGKNIGVDEAAAFIAGYTIFNDISARDTQAGEMTGLLGPAKGKDFDTGNIMGPCIVTADDFDIGNCTMTARINGEVWSEGNTSTMHWSCAQIVAYMSQSETLYPGDFIGSGTVAGGSGAELDRWIRVGDTIELEVEGIGVLRNKVIREENENE